MQNSPHMEGEQYTVPGVTGIDLQLPVAGPGSRSYAFVIDWHIRFLVAISWLLIGMLLVNREFTLRGDNGKPSVLLTFTAIVPAAVIYFLYHPVLEVLMHGVTPGKRIAGVRIVNRDGSTPRAGALLIRNVFRLIDSLPSFYFVGLIMTVVTAQRVRVGDLAAGTLLIMEDIKTAQDFSRDAASDGPLEFATADLVGQLLERWPQLARDKRTDIARSLLRRIPDAPTGQSLDGMTDLELHERLTRLIRKIPGVGEET